MEWISVGERLPKQHKAVLLMYGEKMIVGYFNGLRFLRDGYTLIKKPTHWMPLPEPPKI